MRFQDGLIGCASGLVIGVIIAWFTLIQRSLRAFGQITDEAVLYSGLILLICSGLGVFAVVRYFQAWSDVYEVDIPLINHDMLLHFLIDAFALQKYRLLRSDDATLVFQSIRPTPHGFSAILTPLPHDRAYITVRLTDSHMTLTGPFIRKEVLQAVSAQVAARNG